MRKEIKISEYPNPACEISQGDQSVVISPENAREVMDSLTRMMESCAGVLNPCRLTQREAALCDIQYREGLKDGYSFGENEDQDGLDRRLRNYQGAAKALRETSSWPGRGE